MMCDIEVTIGLFVVICSIVYQVKTYGGRKHNA